MPRRIRRGTFVNAAELVMRRCPARTQSVKRASRRAGGWVGETRFFHQPVQFAGLDAVAGASSALGARRVARYMVTALASLSLSPKAGILVSGFIA